MNGDELNCFTLPNPVVIPYATWRRLKIEKILILDNRCKVLDSPLNTD